MQISRLFLLALASSTMIGCASISKDSNQPVHIETYNQKNEKIENAKCLAKNDRGEWVANSPGIIMPHRSGKNLTITCTKENEEAGNATLISRANGGMWGNILFGGGIGAIIDHNKGTAYSYPDWVKVILGQHLIFDRKKNVEGEIMAGETASEEMLAKINQEKQKDEELAKQQAEQNKAK